MYITIKCPACDTGTVLIEPRQLAMGTSFSCANCAASIAISPKSVSTLSSGLDEFERLKMKLKQLDVSDSVLQLK